MRWGERAARNSQKARDVWPPGSHVTLAPNCPPHGVQGAADPFRLQAHPRGETCAQVLGTKGPSLRARPPDASPSAAGPGRPCPPTADSVPLSFPLCLGGGGSLIFTAATQSEKTPQELPGLLGKQALQSVPGDTGHQTGRPGSAAASGSRGVERSPRSMRQEEAGKAETREQPLGCRPRPGLALAEAGGRSR